MAKTFNKFFCLVAQEVQLKVPFSYKTFFEYLPPHNVHTAPFCRQELNLLPNFQKGGALTGPQLLDGVVRKEGATFLRRGCQFYIKNKLKSEIFIDKKIEKQKCFFLSITKNLNWEILTKNLLSKDGMGLRMKILLFKRGLGKKEGSVFEG